MAFDAEQYRKGAKNDKKESSHIHLSSALIFLSFGIILILKLLKIDIAFLKYIPDVVLYWIVAIGSTFGGLYMIYRKYIYRQRLIVR